MRETDRIKSQRFTQKHKLIRSLMPSKLEKFLFERGQVNSRLPGSQQINHNNSQQASKQRKQKWKEKARVNSKTHLTFLFPIYISIHNTYTTVYTLCFSSMLHIASLSCSGGARISIQGGQDLLLYYIFSIISINYKYIFYIKTKITNLYSSQ